MSVAIAIVIVVVIVVVIVFCTKEASSSRCAIQSAWEFQETAEARRRPGR